MIKDLEHKKVVVKAEAEERAVRKLSYEEVLQKLNDELSVEDNWDDFDAMIQDMKQHAKDNGQAIVMNDQPYLFRFGWLCKQTGKSWSMRIKQFRKYTEELKNSDDEFKQKKSLILTSAFLTQEGKYNLLAVINGT